MRAPNINIGSSNVDFPVIRFHWLISPTLLIGHLPYLQAGLADLGLLLKWLILSRPRYLVLAFIPVSPAFAATLMLKFTL